MQDPAIGRGQGPVSGRGRAAIEKQQKAQRQHRGGGTSGDHGLAAAAGIRSGRGQEQDRNRHGAGLLRKLNENQGPDPPGGGKIARHNAV